MRINKLKISNILSFPYAEDIDSALDISFDPTLNIIIGSNGSGKSTVLEVINFIFKRVLFKPYEFSENYFNNTSSSTRLETFRVNAETQKYKNTFRLNPNWESENKTQTIKVTIQLDAIDKANIDTIVAHYSDITTLTSQYSRTAVPSFAAINGDEEIELAITLNSNDDSFSFPTDGVREDIISYLTDYDLFREVIALHNQRLTETDYITPLDDTFTMLSAFRNYHSFSVNASLNQDHRTQLRGIRQSNSSRGINTPDNGEPSIFSVVKLKLASHQYELIGGNKNEDESTKAANNLPMIKNINKKLKIIRLKCSIKLVDRRNWSYTFEFYDTKHKRPLGDISNLSAGQRSIIHLIFEAYGREDMKGGVVVIDEPEIHLHYQFQYEYLQILQEIIKEQKTQYVLVTHSDGFINCDTAPYIKRFSLDKNRHSTVHNPTLTTDQRKLIEILDNTQSARALFGNKVVLVEGQDDRYFFRSIFDNLHPGLRQEVSIYDVGGRDSMPSWKEFFEAYGIIVYQIKDLDAAAKDIYSEAPPNKLNTAERIASFRSNHPTIDTDIEAKYNDRLFILKCGSVEFYMGIRKGLANVIEYCRDIHTFIDAKNDQSDEVLQVVQKIVG